MLKKLICSLAFPSEFLPQAIKSASSRQIWSFKYWSDLDPSLGMKSSELAIRWHITRDRGLEEQDDWGASRRASCSHPQCQIPHPHHGDRTLLPEELAPAKQPRMASMTWRAPAVGRNLEDLPRYMEVRNPQRSATTNEGIYGGGSTTCSIIYANRSYISSHCRLQAWQLMHDPIGWSQRSGSYL
jgi:hypothetical protein